MSNREFQTAQRVAAVLESYLDTGRLDEPYEEVFRQVLQQEPQGTFGVEDVTGLPWIEIDFPEDRERAEKDILPRLP